VSQEESEHNEVDGMKKGVEHSTEKANNTKYSKTKLVWCNRLIQHSSRKRLVTSTVPTDDD